MPLTFKHRSNILSTVIHLLAACLRHRGAKTVIIPCRSINRLIILLFLVGLDCSANQSSTTISQSPDEKQLTDDPANQDAYFAQTFEWFVEKRNSWSKGLGSMGREVDGFFADTEAEGTENKSFVKIGVFNVWRKIEGIDPETRFRFRLHLPYTEERLKFVVENEPEETLSLEERNRQNVLRKEETTESLSAGYFRVLLGLEQWKFNGDIGLRLRNPLDPFVRGKANRKWKLEDDLVFRIKETVSYFNSEGISQTSQAYFEKELSEELFFRSKTEAQWFKEKDGWEFAQTFSMTEILNTQSAMVYRFGWLMESRPHFRTTSTYVNLTYRQKLFRDWLFLEFTPELLFPRDDNFKPNPSLTFGLELLFAE